MRIRPFIAATVTVAAMGAGAPAPAHANGVEHTVTAFTIERDGVRERDERVETWVSRRRAKVVYTDAATGDVLGACTGTRRTIRCYDRDPRLQFSGPLDGELFLPTWAESGRAVRRGLARGWVKETGPATHRGTPARRLVSTPDATGDVGETTILAARGSLAVLFRQTRGELISTEDVVLRERLRRAEVDFRLRPPEGKRVRTLAVPR